MMFMPFILFIMIIMVTGNSDDSDVVQTLSSRLYDGDVLYEHRSCRSKCHRKCQKDITKKVQKVRAKCWLIKDYRLDSGNIALCN